MADRGAVASTRARLPRHSERGPSRRAAAMVAAMPLPKLRSSPCVISRVVVRSSGFVSSALTPPAVAPASTVSSGRRSRPPCVLRNSRQYSSYTRNCTAENAMSCSKHARHPAHMPATPSTARMCRAAATGPLWLVASDTRPAVARAGLAPSCSRFLTTSAGRNSTVDPSSLTAPAAKNTAGSRRSSVMRARPAFLAVSYTAK
mmetsp:Transcript_7179/g.25630  ORF Transcript_7179/g.25630 Transcript_7179/m.25630 type:complete len:203 (+) Transcript_7179:189-797(+)